MRLLIGGCLAMLLSGCSFGGSSSPLGSAPIRKIAREVVDASSAASRNAVARSCQNAKQSLTQDFGLTSGATDVLTLFNDRVTVGSAKRLGKQLRSAQPAVTRALTITARVEAKRSLRVLCATASKLPIAKLC